jgi:hypothetical protein
MQFVAHQHAGEITVVVSYHVRRMFCSSGGGHIDKKGEHDIGYITSTL